MSFDSNPDPGRTLGQFGLAVLALVLGAAALFWAIDLVSDDAQPTAAVTTSPAETPATSPSAPVSPTPASPTPAAPTPTPAPTTAEPTPEPTEQEPTPEPTEAEPTEAEPTEPEPTEPEPTEAEPTEDPEPTEDEEPATDVDPSETSLQVLDAIKDGSDRAREIADDLEEDGYNLVAFGPSSIVYDNTTVFWTDGHEDEAQALAEANGWDEVVNNDILSESVDVHVVVGLDEQE